MFLLGNSGLSGVRSSVEEIRNPNEFEWIFLCQVEERWFPNCPDGIAATLLEYSAFWWRGDYRTMASFDCKG